MLNGHIESSEDCNYAMWLWAELETLCLDFISTLFTFSTLTTAQLTRKTRDESRFKTQCNNCCSEQTQQVKPVEGLVQDCGETGWTPPWTTNKQLGCCSGPRCLRRLIVVAAGGANIRHCLVWLSAVTVCCDCLPWLSAVTVGRDCLLWLVCCDLSAVAVCCGSCTDYVFGASCSWTLRFETVHFPLEEWFFCWFWYFICDHVWQ